MRSTSAPPDWHWTMDRPIPVPFTPPYPQTSQSTLLLLSVNYSKEQRLVINRVFGPMSKVKQSVLFTPFEELVKMYESELQKASEQVSQDQESKRIKLS